MQLKLYLWDVTCCIWALGFLALACFGCVFKRGEEKRKGGKRRRKEEEKEEDEEIDLESKETRGI